jgi:Zn-dependent hydrolases, including glyoxylases
LIKIDKHIKLLDVPGWTYPFCNCLWIDDDITCLIDSSPSENDRSFLKKQKVDILINTHAHMDHIQCNRDFHNSIILMHAAEHETAQSGDKYLEEYGVKKFGRYPQFYSQVLKRWSFITSRVDGEIKDKQVINLGSTSFEVLHLPGHSAGHCGFIFPKKGFIFITDITLAKFGPVYCTMSASVSDFINSLDLLIDMKPDYIISSHNQPIMRGANLLKRMVEYRDIIYTRQKSIVDLLVQGHHSVAEIASAAPIHINLPYPKSIFFIFEQTMVLHHLQYLQAQDYVVEDGGLYYLTSRAHSSRM